MTPPVKQLTLTVEKVVAVGAPPNDGVRGLLSFEEIYSQWFHDVSRWVRALGGMGWAAMARSRLRSNDLRSCRNPTRQYADGSATFAGLRASQRSDQTNAEGARRFLQFQRVEFWMTSRNAEP